jgi:hypothetical protein
MITIESQIQNLSSASRRGKPFQICGHRKFKIEALTTLFSGPINPVKWPCCRPRSLGLSSLFNPISLSASAWGIVGSEIITIEYQNLSSDSPAGNAFILTTLS